MTNTTTFDVDTINIFTTCMQIVFESYYKQFEPTTFNRFSKPCEIFTDINKAIKWSKKMGASLADFIDDIIDLADKFDQTLDPKILMEDYTPSNFEIIDFCQTYTLPIEKSVPWIFTK